MIWLELRLNNREYNSGWNFSESAWAPTKTKKNRNWPFWNLIASVTKGDIVFHIRYISGEKKIVGCSIAKTDGYITKENPTTDKHEWDFIDSFHKVELTEYQELKPQILLSNYFINNRDYLLSFFRVNKKRKDKHRLFYVFQNNRLQCLNGGYFSDFPEEIASLVLSSLSDSKSASSSINEVSITGEILRQLRLRIGHQQFAENVKKNYGYKCCFPHCEVEGKGFLVSGHIARWADHHELRGNTGNGLCLCLIHDKAFEKGMFILDDNFRVVIVEKNTILFPWLLNQLRIGESKEIKSRQINPMIEALSIHRMRIGYI